MRKTLIDLQWQLYSQSALEQGTIMNLSNYAYLYAAVVPPSLQWMQSACVATKMHNANLQPALT